MPKAKVNGVEVEFEAGMTALQVAEMAGEEIPRFCYHQRLSITVRTLVLIATASAGLLAACDMEFEGSSETSETVTVSHDGAEQPAGQDARVRVCAAATHHVTSEPGDPVSWREVDKDTVRLELGPDQADGAEVVECDFTKDKVTWRTVDGTKPAQFSPETLTYKVEGNTVRVSQSTPGSTRVTRSATVSTDR
ncbi:MAG TPA: hypothetical protein VEY69_16200 [Lautropia sp.]|nr:hypothetical protein [Lautropia sp.]